MVIRSHKSKVRQYNGLRKEQKTNNDLQSTTQKIRNWARRPPTVNGENWGARKGIHNVVDCVLYIIYYFENHLDNLGEYLTQEIGKGCTYIVNV
jgi:hypothetical protein